MKLFLHVTTVLYAEGSDPQVLDANALPSRVVAAAPSGRMRDLFQLVGSEVEVPTESGMERPTREHALRALREFVAAKLGGAAMGFDLVESGADEIPSIPRGNTYIRPFLPNPNGGVDFAFGFPIGRVDGAEAPDAPAHVLLNPPLGDEEVPKIWARYHVILSNVPPQDPTLISAEEVQAAQQRALDASRSPSHGRDLFQIFDGEASSVVRGIFAAKMGERVEEQEGELRFTRMFSAAGKGVLPEGGGSPHTAALDRLARSMLETPESGVEQRSRTNISAGHAFFGQFLTHELSRAEQRGLPMTSNSSMPTQLGSPTLDMESLYGGGPQANPEFFEGDRVRMRLGTTAVDDPGRTARELDLPRRPGESTAVIADARNDGNLAIAQMHVAMIRFHNKVVEELRARGEAESGLFEAAQREVRRSVQSITWFDFANQITDPSTYRDATSRMSADSGYQPRYWQNAGDQPGMPIEFSVAAFRLGHSLIRSSYEWNDERNDLSEVGAVDLQQMFRMTGGFGLGGSQQLPDDWVVDWRRMVPHPEGVITSMWPRWQKSRPLDAYASPAMHHLPPQVAALGNLPKLNLMRGDRVGLPSGQDLERAMGLERSFDPIGEHEDPVGRALKDSVQFATQTPLWLYLLREAELTKSGNCLGEMGSHIVLDTLGVLIDRSPDSFVTERGWQPCWTDRRPQELRLTDLMQAAGLME